MAPFHQGDKDAAPFYRERHLRIHHRFIFGPHCTQYTLEDGPEQALLEWFLFNPKHIRSKGLNYSVLNINPPKTRTRFPLVRVLILCKCKLK